MVGAKYAVAVTSASHGQDLVMKAKGFKGIDVINPTMSFIATAQIPLWNDCTTNIVDVQEWDLNIDPQDVKARLKRNKKTAFVENLFYDYMDGYYSINNGYLKVTREHDLFTYADKKWRWNTARELKEGMKLLNFLGEIVNIDSVEWIDGEVEVINFDVEPLDIYYAGGVLVHNKGASSEP